MPKVSIVVPNFNHARFLPRRLDSLLEQTFRDFEVIVLDDASTDGSHEVIRRYLADPRFRFHPGPVNSGSPFVQWNRGVDLASGEYVWIAESDDFADAEFLETLVPILDEGHGLGLVCSQSWQVDENGTRIGCHDPHGFEDSIGRHRSEIVLRLLWQNIIPNASAVLFRKRIYLKAGGAPSDMRLCGDWMMWVKMLEIGDIAFHPGILNSHRSHPSSVRETAALAVYFREKWRIQRRILGRRGLRRKLGGKVAKRVARDFERLRRSGGGASGSFGALLPFLLAHPIVVLRQIMRKRRRLP